MASKNRLSDIPWKLKYSPEDGSLLKTFRKSRTLVAGRGDVYGF
jgi:hypothetical protein